MKKGILKGTIFITILTLISKILGFTRESVIAATFGTTYVTDVYVFVTGMAAMLFTAIGEAISTTFIPILSEYQVNKSKEENEYFINNILNIILLISFILSIISFFGAEYLVGIFGPGFKDKYNVYQYTQVVIYTKLISISLIFIAMQNIFQGVLQAHKKFIAPALSSIFYNFILIIYFITIAKKFGALGVTISLIFAYVTQAIVCIPAYKKLGYKYKLIINFKHESIKRIFKLIIPVFIGASILQINFMVDRALASSFGEGGISTLSFANRLNVFVYSVLSTGIITVIYPTLSTLSAEGNKEEYNRILHKSIINVSLLILPIATLVVVLKRPLVEIVFKRGAFDMESVINTANILAFYAPGTIVFTIRDILNRALYSVKNTKVAMINSSIGVIINIILNIILSKRMGLAGLALATTISACTTTILLMISLKKIIDLDIKQIIIKFIKILFPSILMGIVINLILNYYLKNNNILLQKNIIILIIFGSIGTLIYSLLISFYNFSEIKSIKESIGKFLKHTKNKKDKGEVYEN